jgi:hypothetical protein
MRVCLWSCLLLLGATAHAQSVVSSEVIGDVPATYDSKYVLSPDGRHIGVVKSSGSRRLVSIDGVDGELFDSIEYVVQPQPGKSGVPMVVFSPDGSRHAYAAKRGGASVVVVDGKTYPEGREFLFSPDSKHFAYVTGAQHGGASVTVALDGTPSPQYRAVRDLRFSDDGKRLVYAALIGNEWHVVADGKPGVGHAQVLDLRLAPSGKHYAYVGITNGEFVPVIDGVVQTNAGRSTSMGTPVLALSEDGRRWGFVSIKQSGNGYAFRAVIDGKPGAACMRIENLQFSPDGKRFAYIGSVGSNVRDLRDVLMVDGKQVGLEYRTIRDLQFSPDSRHFAAFAETDAGNFVLLDGTESEAFTHPVTDFRFSNSGRYAFVGRPKSGNVQQVYVDGKAQAGIDELQKNTMHFSPDGARLVFSAVKRYPEYFTSIDGKIESMNIITNMGPFLWKDPVVFSRDGRHMAFMSTGSPFNLYLDLQPAADGLSYALPTFSADARHFAVAAQPLRAKQWTGYIDGKAFAEFDDIIGASPASWQFTADGKLSVVAMQGGKFRRWIVDPQSSSIDSFAANMSKAGKGGKKSNAGAGATAAGTSGKTAKPGKSAVANGNPVGNLKNDIEGDVKNDVQENTPDPQHEAQSKVDEMGTKTKNSIDKKLKKLKGLFGDKK